jgi:hypothetical protein
MLCTRVIYLRRVCVQVSQAMNSGTAAELKASEAMVKKDHAGVCSGAVQWCSVVK